MILYKKTVDYYNQYICQNSSIELHWKFEDGFNTKDDAIKVIRILHQQPKYFTFITFNKMIYAVAMNSLKDVMVVSKDFVWLNDVYLLKYPWHNLDPVPYVINTVKLPSIYTNQMVEDLNTFDNYIRCDIPDTLTCKPRYIKPAAITLLGCAMFISMIPVKKMNCIDKYFSYNSPSKWALKSTTIKSYNPFTHEKTFW